MTLLSIFTNELWPIALVLFIGLVVFSYQTYKASRSNSTTQVGLGTPDAHTEDNTGNVPFYKVPQFKFVIGFVLALVAFFVINYLER